MPPFVDALFHPGYQNTVNDESRKLSVSATIPKGSRINVTLDSNILIEDLILKQLNKLPKCRHKDRIRSLLVQGFLVESRVLRQSNSVVSANKVAKRPVKRSLSSGFDFANWVGSSSRPTQVKSKKRDVPSEAPLIRVEQSSTSKPFAQLCKVVG